MACYIALLPYFTNIFDTEFIQQKLNSAMKDFKIYPSSFRRGCGLVRQTTEE
jgi:hypothetical protein